MVNVTFPMQLRASYIQVLEFGKKKRNLRASVCSEKVNIENAIKHAWKKKRIIF